MKTIKSTYEKTSDLLKDNNKKIIFDLLYLNTNGEVSETIIMFIKDCSSTFCSDIASKIFEDLKSGDRVFLSEKQSWCLTFEALKIQHQLDLWIEKEIKLSL